VSQGDGRRILVLVQGTISRKLLHAILLQQCVESFSNDGRLTGQHWRANDAFEPCAPSAQQTGGGKVVKTAIGLLTLALAIAAATPAAADPTPLRLIPPKQYDHPYKGNLVVHVVGSQQEVRRLCPGSAFSWIGALGCAHLGKYWCVVVMAPDDVITKAGFPPELIKRHEIAHCNGWPSNHRGAEVFEDWAEEAAMRALECTLPFSPVVCEKR
jgi:hypothetical protein